MYFPHLQQQEADGTPRVRAKPRGVFVLARRTDRPPLWTWNQHPQERPLRDHDLFLLSLVGGGGAGSARVHGRPLSEWVVARRLATRSARSDAPARAAGVARLGWCSLRRRE